jgi:hypothetical protein
MDEYRKNNGEWSVYEKKFLELLSERAIEDRMRGILSDRDCLLCSESSPALCHRRLIAEYLKKKWGKITIQHISP